MQTATIKKRLLALLIDYLIILAFALVVLGCTLAVSFAFLGGLPQMNELQSNLVSLVLFLPVLVYSIFCEAGKKRGTPGKRALKIQVAPVGQGGLKPWQAIVRNCVKFAPWEFAHIVIFKMVALNAELPPVWMGMMVAANILPVVWLMVVLCRKDHRGLHDLAAKTQVISKQATL